MGFLSVGVIFHFLPPILPEVIQDLGISHGQAGLLMSLFALPGILLSLPGGWLVDRYGERLIGSLGVVTMGGGTVLLGLATSFPLILLARVLSGVGAMVGVVALQRLVIRLFAGRGLGLPVGISGSAVPVGIIIVLNTAGPVAARAGWRLVALRAGGVAVIIGLAFALVTWLVTRGRNLGREAGQEDASLAAKGASFRPIWIAGAVWFCANGAMTAFMTFAPDHFQGLGFSVSARGLFTSIPMWTSALLGMVTGWLTDRHGGRAVFMAAGMGLMGGALIVLPTSLVSPSLIGLLLGLALAAVVTPTIALPGALLPPSHTGRGYGILATCANLGIFLVPPAAGWSRDVSGSYLWPFVIMGATAFVGVAAAEVLRRGRFVPGISRRALVAVSLLLLAGCGSQDRYELVAPGTPVMDVVTGGRLTDLSLLLSNSNYGLNAADAWAQDDLVVGGSYGRLIRVQGDLCTNLHPPVEDYITGVVCRPDGSLVLATREEGLWVWRAGQWQQDTSVPIASIRRLARDHQGRLLVEGYAELNPWWREEAGTWQEVADGSWGDVSSIWAEAGQETWLVTETHNLWRLGDNGAAVWSDSLAFQDTRSSVNLAGDGSGNLACLDWHGELWLRLDGTWRQVAQGPSSGVKSLFWMAGKLFGIEDGVDLVAWEDDAWQLVQDKALPENAFVVRSVAGGNLVIDYDGGGSLFDGQQARLVSPSVKDPRGFAVLGGQRLVLEGGGNLYRIEDGQAGVWRRVGQTGAPAVTSGLNALFVDDRGRLIAVTRNGFEEWDGAEFSLFHEFRYLDYLQVIPGRESLFVDNDGAVGILQGGVVWMDDNPDQLVSDITGLWRRSEARVDVLTRIGMYTWTPGSRPVLAWLATNWRPRGLLVLDQQEAVLFGNRAARWVTGDQIRDITPYYQSGTERAPTTLSAVYALNDKQLLAWSISHRSFLLWDKEAWHELVPAVSDVFRLEESWETPSFVADEQQNLLLFNRDYLFQIESTGGAW